MGENEKLKSAYNYGRDSGYADGFVDGYKAGVKDVDPKKGKWVDIVEMDSGGYPFKVGLCCSVCGAPTLSDDNYCPHCGAKMEVTE